MTEIAPKRKKEEKAENMHYVYLAFHFYKPTFVDRAVAN
jgi:hypothetical protein